MKLIKIIIMIKNYLKKKNEIQNIGKKEIKYYETILKNLKQPE